MNKKWISFLVTLVLLFSGLPVTGNDVERREQLIEIIDQELREVIRLNRQIGSKKPSLLLRMAELYLEKARLYLDKENMQWLSLSPEEIAKKNKETFFKNSRKYFVAAQKTCYFILKRFGNFKGKADVYYILAYNAKEFQRPKKAKKFFQNAIQFSKKGSYTKIKSKLALAEMLYNEKKYSSAIPLYEAALKRRDQKWWTKDAFNLAWCYFRVGKKSKAINLMSQIHKLSGNSSFVDVSDQVERDLAYFYSESGRTKDAFKFYNKIGKDYSTNFLKVGKYLKNNGKFTSAEKAFIEAKKRTKNQSLKNQINNELLSLYDRFGKTSKHLEICLSLYESYKRGKLNEEQIENLKYHVSRMSAKLQRQVVSKVYRKQKGIKVRKAKLATQYFKILNGISGGTGHRSMFHAAETQYSVGDFNKAAELYNAAFEKAKLAKDSKIVSLSLDGLIASLGNPRISKATEKKYLGKAYAFYLKKNPRSKESFKIYQRLFKQQIDNKNIRSAEKTLLEFKFHFPAKRKIQEAMLARVIDYYKLKKDQKELKKWVDKINSGEFRVTKTFAKRLSSILLSIQFDKVQKLSSSGEKLKALKGYLTIYKDSTSSKDAKKNAAYNIGILFFDLGNKDKSYRWMKLALSQMSKSEVLEFENSFLKVASGLFNLRDLERSADIYEVTLEKLCRVKRFRNKTKFFKNATIIYLANNNSTKAKEMIKLGKKCNVKKGYLKILQFDLLSQYAKEERWSQFETLLISLKKDVNNYPSLIASYYKLLKIYQGRGGENDETKIRSEIFKMYKESRRRGYRIPLESLDIYAKLKIEDLRGLVNRFNSQKLTFPEERYNQILKRKFSLIDKITNLSIQIIQIGSGEGLVEAYKILVESYKKLSSEINNFKPSNRSAQFVKSFRSSMEGIIGPVASKAKEFEEEAKSRIKNLNILSSHNSYFLGDPNLPVAPVYFNTTNGVLMDRGGKQ